MALMVGCGVLGAIMLAAADGVGEVISSTLQPGSADSPSLTPPPDAESVWQQSGVAAALVFGFMAVGAAGVLLLRSVQRCVQKEDLSEVAIVRTPAEWLLIESQLRALLTSMGIDPDADPESTLQPSDSVRERIERLEAMLRARGVDPQDPAFSTTTV